MKKIKLFDPVIGISEEREMIKILRSGFWASGSGSGKVQEFEKKFSKRPPPGVIVEIISNNIFSNNTGNSNQGCYVIKGNHNRIYNNQIINNEKNKC